MTDRDIQLLNQLEQKTRERELSWEPTAVPDQFMAAWKDKAFFYASRYGDEAADRWEYAVTLMDNQSRELLRLATRGLHGEFYALLERVYAAAHDDALKVEETVGEILADFGRTG